MRAMNKAVSVQFLEVLSNRDLRSFETAGQVQDEYTSLAIHCIKNCPPTLFVQHSSSWKAGTAAFPWAFFLYRLLSYVQSGELKAGFEAQREAERIQSRNLAAQDFAHLAGENLQRERLLQEGGSRLEYAMVNDGIFGIPGEVKHFDLRAAGRNALGEFASTHSRHHDIG